MILGTDTEDAEKNAHGTTYDEVAEFIGKGWIWKQVPEGFSPATYQIPPFSVTTTINSGDQIDLGPRGPGISERLAQKLSESFKALKERNE